MLAVGVVMCEQWCGNGGGGWVAGVVVVEWW